jgi:flagellar motor switch protein FliN/FliY
MMNPYLRKISETLLKHDAIPLFGNTPSFDFKRFSSLLASRFGVQHLSVNAKEQGWKKENEIKAGLGRNLMTIPLGLTPLEGTIFWIMPEADIAKLTAWMLHGKTKTRALSSELLQEGFYRYLLLETLDALQNEETFQGLTLHLSEDGSPFETASFCIDVEISFEKQSCWGRLVLPPVFRKSWVRHFASRAPHLSETAKKTEVFAHVKTGSVTLTLKEWKGLSEGDFVLLDEGGYDARKSMGAALLTFGDTPLFNVKIKHNKIEILDYAFYYEEPMTEKSRPAGSKEEMASMKEMPLSVSVELARLRITLDQLMQLKPGNMLELPIQSDQDVALTVNGQKVGRAELVYLGEALGIRILEIG